MAGIELYLVHRLVRSLWCPFRPLWFRRPLLLEGSRRFEPEVIGIWATVLNGTGYSASCVVVMKSSYQVRIKITVLNEKQGREQFFFSKEPRICSMALLSEPGQRETDFILGCPRMDRRMWIEKINRLQKCEIYILTDVIEYLSRTPRKSTKHK